MNSLASRETPVPVAQISDPVQLGQVLAASGYFSDARDAAKAAVKVMAGAELGLGPVASMRGIDIIKGEVSLSAGLTAALVRRSERYDYNVVRWDETGCTIVFTRNGQPLDPPSSFTDADAQRAGLGGDAYRKYPRNMYFARAMTNGARIHCPDLFAGSVYVPEELGEFDADDAESPAPAAPTAGELPAAPVPAGDRQGGAAASPPAPAEAPTEARSPADQVTETEATRLRELAQTLGITPGWLRMALSSQGVQDAGDPIAALNTLTVGQATAVLEAMKRRG